MTAEYILSTDAPKYILISGEGDLTPFKNHLEGEIIEGFDAPFCRIPFTNENAIKLRAFLKGKDYEIPLREKTILKFLADNPDSVTNEKIRWATKLTDLRANKLPKKFAKIQTEWDLIHYFPLRYLDKSNPQKISDLILGQWAVVAGVVQNIETNYQHSFVKIVIADISNRRIAATFFRQTWLAKKYREGDEVIIYGNYSEYVNKKTNNRYPQILNPSIDKITTINPSGKGYGMLPIYPQKSENRSWQIKTAQEALLDSIIWIDDPVPTRILEKYDLPSRAEAYRMIHFPEDKVEVEKARRRIAFDEFVRLQVYLKTRKDEMEVKTASRKDNHEWSNKFIESLPFSFTNAQKRVVQELRTDLQSNHPMHRLLQGDVGSGKAQPLYSQILTPQGFTTMGDIQKGNQILTPQGNIETVIETYPQGERPVYEICFDDGTKVHADENHLWKVAHKNNPTRYILATTKTLTQNPNIQWVIETPKIGDYGKPWNNTQQTPHKAGMMIANNQLNPSTEEQFIISDTNEILNFNKTVRKQILQGILDSHPQAKLDANSITLTHETETLPQLTANLIRSLAGTAKVIHKDTQWQLVGELNNQTPHKTIQTITYIGEKETKCILITGEEHLYVTDGFTTTHNTEIASTAILSTIASGYQAAMLAPTDILANQLHERLDATFKKAGLNINVALFTGKIIGKKRVTLLEQLAAGEIDVLVGTHTLTQDYVKFKNLGLAVIDESHKYGSEQRTALKKENPDGSTPDFLSMSATPIPRSTAQVVYGDLDISIVDELPANRLPIQTFWDQQPDNAWAKIREEVEKGHKAYVVAALVEDSDKESMADIESATSTAAMLQQQFPNFKVELLHGKMKKNEKAEISERFLKGNSQILVATSLIEVGLNSPDATVMVVLNANRFGIASLHQIRGRVGRSDLQSYCYLVGEATMPEAEERLRALVSSNDGFWLAEKDLEIRGEGELFGRFQSGNSDLYLANLKEHKDLLEIAKRVGAQAGKNPVMQYEVNTLYKDKKILS